MAPLILLVLSLIFIIPYVMIIRKAGYSGWWVLTMIIPLVALSCSGFSPWRADPWRIVPPARAPRTYSSWLHLRADAGRA